MDYDKTEHAEYGRYGCDLPIKTIEMLMDHMMRENPDLDVILVLGDNIGHKIVFEDEPDDSDELDFRYEIFKGIMRDVYTLFSERFPETYILPVSGNNDNIIKYQPPESATDRQELYSWLGYEWFEK